MYWQNKAKVYIKTLEKTRNNSETYMPSLVQNSGLSSLQKQNQSEASKQGIKGLKIYKVDKTLGSKEWFDLDLRTCDLKINRDHLLIKGNPCTKFGIDQVKGSKDIDRTTLGLQTERPTDRPTVAKQYAPFFKGGIKIKIPGARFNSSGTSFFDFPSPRHTLC